MKEDKFLEAIGMVLIVVTVSLMAFISSDSKAMFGEATVGKAFGVTKIAISEGGLVG